MMIMFIEWRCLILLSLSYSSLSLTLLVLHVFFLSPLYYSPPPLLLFSYCCRYGNTQGVPPSYYEDGRHASSVNSEHDVSVNDGDIEDGCSSYMHNNNDRSERGGIERGDSEQWDDIRPGRYDSDASVGSLGSLGGRRSVRGRKKERSKTRSEVLLWKYFLHSDVLSR